MDMKSMMTEERDAMLLHKYLESEKAGRDLGDASMLKWVKEHGAEWRKGYYRRNMMNLGDGTTPEYFAVFLDSESSRLLLEEFGGGAPSGWDLYCTECVLCMGDPASDIELVEFLVENLGNTVDLVVETIGVSVESIAIGVAGKFPGVDGQKYIVLGVPAGNDPHDIKGIKRWEPVKLPRLLHGRVDSYPSHFK